MGRVDRNDYGAPVVIRVSDALREALRRWRALPAERRAEYLADLHLEAQGERRCAEMPGEIFPGAKAQHIAAAETAEAALAVLIAAGDE